MNKAEREETPHKPQLSLSPNFMKSPSQNVKDQSVAEAESQMDSSDAVTPTAF